MGGLLSRSRERDELCLRFASTRAALHLSSGDLWSLYVAFRRGNSSGSGTLTYAEWVEMVDIEVEPFTKRLFDMFRGHGEGGIDFKNFVLLSWNVCSSDVDSLSVLAFSCYDRDGDGNMDLRDVITMLTELFGDGYREIASVRFLEQSLCQLDMTNTPKSAQVDVDMFVQHFTKASTALFHTFNVQQSMRRNILGTSFWNKQTAKRKRLVAAKQFSMEPVLALLNEYRSPESRFIAYGMNHFVIRRNPALSAFNAAFAAFAADKLAPIDSYAASGSTTAVPTPTAKDLIASPSAIPISFASPSGTGLSGASSSPGTSRNGVHLVFDSATY